MRYGVVHLTHLLPVLVLAIGPETILPLTAGLAALGGTVLLAWRHVADLVRLLWRTDVKKSHLPPQA